MYVHFLSQQITKQTSLSCDYGCDAEKSSALPSVPLLTTLAHRQADPRALLFSFTFTATPNHQTFLSNLRTENSSAYSPYSVKFLT
ncbi:hypothetical protein VTL71DRAFT_15271, partial [Oculimacula yallundae]